MNEINKDLAGKSTDNNHYLFKTPSTSEQYDLIVAEVQKNRDPRDYQHTAGALEQHLNSVSEFPYSSRLREYDHRNLLAAASTKPKTIYNQKYLTSKNNEKNNFRTKEIDKRLNTLLTQEVEKFKKCAEVEFYKNVEEIEKFVGADWKFFFNSCWQENIKKQPKSKYQIITTIQLLQDEYKRDDIRCVCNKAPEPIKKHENQINTRYFPQLSHSIPDLLNFYNILKSTEVSWDEDKELENAQMILSMNTLSMLINTHRDQSVNFEIQEDDNYKKCAIFGQELPPVSANLADVLQFGAEKSLLLSLECANFDEYLGKQMSPENIPTNYKVHQTTSCIDQKFKKFVSGKRKDCQHLWNFTKNKETFKVLVLSTFNFASESVPINISIKLEYQTQFGVENMTLEKLLEEWCISYFTPKSLIYRYSMDVKSVTLLSLKILTLQDIEDEIKSLYNIDIKKLFADLLNLFGCIERLPVGKYLLQVKKEKRDVFKKVEQGTTSLDLETSYSSTDIKENLNDIKWIPINCQEPGLLHIKNNFAPGTFPYWTKKEKYQLVGTPGQVAATNKMKIRGQAIKKKNNKIQNMRAARRSPRKRKTSKIYNI